MTADGRWVGALAGRWGSQKGWNSVHLWDLDTGRETFRLEHAGIQRFDISPTGERIVLYLVDGFIELWNVAPSARLARWECAETDVRELRLGLNLERVVVALGGGSVQTFCVGHERGQMTIVGRAFDTRCVATTSTGNEVALGRKDGTLEYRSLRDGQQSMTELRPTGPESSFDIGPTVTAVALAEDAHHLVSAASDGKLRVWDLARVRTATAPRTPNPIIRLTPDGQRALFLAEDRTILVRNLVTGADVCSIERNDAELMSHDGRWIASTLPNGLMRVWNVTTGTTLSEMAAKSCALLPHRHRIIYLSRERPYALYVSDLTHETPYDPPPIDGRPLPVENIFLLVTAPDEERIVAVVGGAGVLAWEWGGRTSRCAVANPSQDQPYRAYTDGQRLIMAFHDRIEAWDLVTGIEIVKIPTSAWSRSSALTPDGTRVVVAVSNAVEVWRLDTGIREARFYADALVTAMTCTSDTTFVIGCSDGRVHRLELRDARQNAIG